jgi:beta-lactamase class A
MKRRTALKFIAGTAALPVSTYAIASNSKNAVEHSARFKSALSTLTALNKGQTSISLRIKDANGDRTVDHLGTKPLFVGSAVKTFILGQYLLDVEGGKLNENERLDVGPSVWSPGGDVFNDIQGTIPARNTLEMMIAHSDNTATDMAIKKVGPDRVRELIKRSGLSQTLIPDSTRVLFSYLNGAQAGEDMGWEGMLAMDQGKSFGPIRNAINNQQTMMSTAQEMRQWYDYVLSGQLYKEENTLNEFKRISSMANAIPYLMPDGIMGYGKGGSIDWNDFYCFCVAGQMVLPNTRTVSFCFITNWSGPRSTLEPSAETFMGGSKTLLHALA